MNRITNVESLVDDYCSSLNSDILQECWRAYPLPETLDQWMDTAQNIDTRMRQFQRFKRIAKPEAPTKPKKFFYRRKPMGAKSIRNVEVDDCDVEDEGDEEREEGDEEEIDLEMDICLAGTNTGVCFNCGETGHFSRDCKKPRKPFNKKKPFFNKKKAEDLAKTIRNLDTDTRDALLEAFEKEGF
jgi:hypothetical protein